MIAKTIKLLNLKPDEKEKSMSDLKKICENCTICDLAKTRDKVVFGSGNPKADIVLIGEAPGAEEDASGLPFVGRAGKLLTQIMEKAGLDRKKDLYIINTVKCRPPENRIPTDFENCSSHYFLWSCCGGLALKVKASYSIYMRVGAGRTLQKTVAPFFSLDVGSISF